jgi:hypothetical protein
MNVLITAIEFTGSCLALGLGLFLAGEATREWSRIRPMAFAGTRAVAAAGGVALLTLGVYGALLSLPL